MKIAIVTPVYPPYRGGIGGVAASDARNLRDNGLDVTVFTPDFPGREKSREPYVEYVVPQFSTGNAALLPRLSFRLRKFDFVHLHYPFYGGAFFVWLASMLFRVPYVMTYHMVATATDYRQTIFSLHRWFVEPLILYFARAVVVSSRDYADSLGLHHRNVVEIPFGVDVERFSPGSALAFRDRFNISHDCPVGIFVGGLDRAHFFKGVETLLAAAVLLDKEKPWKLVIVGEGDMRDVYEDRVRSFGLQDRVLFTGAVSHDDLPNAYRAADFHILPSTARNEAFGLVTLEAAATGIPSIVSDLPGVRTVIAPGESGLLVRPGDTVHLKERLEEMFNNAEMRKHFGEKARERAVTVYDQRRLADKLLFVYNR